MGLTHHPDLFHLTVGKAACRERVGEWVGVEWVPFLGGAVRLTGISYGFVRTGCFLAGCDYGKPTASALGVRFPAGSPAAVDHAAQGWVARGGESLPVHATQLYEAGVGVLAAAIASIWLAKGKRDGRAFATFVVLYAVGRFFVEMLRGDGSRGTYGTVSTAQWVSIGLVVTVAALVWHAKREARQALAVAAALAIFLALPKNAMAQTVGGGPAAPPPAVTSSPSAPAPSASGSNVPPPPPVPGAQPYPQQPGALPYPYPPPNGAQPYPYPYPPPNGAQPYPYPQQPGAQPYPYPYPYPYPPPAPQQPPKKEAPPTEEPEKPRPDHQKELNGRRLGLGVGFGLFLTPRFGVSNGGTMEFEATWRVQTSDRARFEFGLGGAYIPTGDASLGGVFVPMRFVAGASRYMEVEVAIMPFYYRITFDSKYFEPVNVFGGRLQPGMGWTLGSHFQLGISPIVVGIMGSTDVKTLFTFEPKVWLRVAAL